MTQTFAKKIAFISGLLLTCLTSLTYAQEGLEQVRGLGNRPPTPAEQAYIDAVYTEVTRVAPNEFARARVQAEIQAARLRGEMGPVADGLPTAVDNSTLQYFPPIGSQGGQNSCSCSAACYYYNTYTQAVDEDHDVSGGDNDYICSPAFMYPLVNGGVDEGVSLQYTVGRLNDIGCCSWTLKPYSSGDWTSWPSEAAWVEALQNRTRTSHVIDGWYQSGLDAIKQHLANGNVAVTICPVYYTWYADYPDNSRTGIDNDVYYYPDGSPVGLHAVTLVGYDDNRSYVDHRDGQTHYGAFLLANSWGSSWGVQNSTGTGTNGFFWVAYEMFLEVTFGPYAYYNDDRDDYRPALYAVAGVNHSQRGYVNLDSEVVPERYSYDAISYDGGTALPVTDADRIAVDISDEVPSTPSQLAVRVYLRVDANATTNATITSADFYHDLDGDGAYLVVSSTDPIVSIAPGTWDYAEAIIPAPIPEVLLEVHPNERAPGVGTNQYIGGQPWSQPTSSPASSYWWKKYEFAAHGPLWIQVCAQNWDKNQKGYLDHDDTKLQVNGVAPTDYDGIQSGTGSWQWTGGMESGKRVTLRFLVPVSPGKQDLWFGADESPALWWLKVIDLEPGIIEAF